LARKPFILVLLAMFYILLPPFKLLLHGFLEHVSAVDLFLFELSHSSLLTFIEEVALFPIAGLLILLVRRWSYFLFLLVEAWIIWANGRSLFALYENGQYLMFFSVVIFTIINIAIVLYFIFSTIKHSYYNPKLRWWEGAPRYTIACNCNISKYSYDHFFNTESVNISEGGMLLRHISDFDIGQKIEIRTIILEDHFCIKGEIVHKTTLPGSSINALGVKFVEVTPVQKAGLKIKMRELERKKYPRRPTRTVFEDLFGGVLPSQFF